MPPPFAGEQMSRGDQLAELRLQDQVAMPPKRNDLMRRIGEAVERATQGHRRAAEGLRQAEESVHRLRVLLMAGAASRVPPTPAAPPCPRCGEAKRVRTTMVLATFKRLIGHHCCCDRCRHAWFCESAAGVKDRTGPAPSAG